MTRIGLILLVLALADPAFASANFRISDAYSPRNAKRPDRVSTRYIVLHTTEGGDRSALSKLRRRGEAHYLVLSSGEVKRIIHKSKVATHAGRSMWNGLRNLDLHSLGIEVVGYHDREIRSTQYAALRELIRQLQSLYGIPDDQVLTHSMVAYGRPNRFHPYNHRGRKRCGMLFADHEVRLKLGLSSRPLEDPDVAARRLRVADPPLQARLYAPPSREVDLASVDSEESRDWVIDKERTAWQIAREAYDSPSTLYRFPDGTELPGDQIADWSSIPSGTRVSFVEDTAESFEGFSEVQPGEHPESIAGDQYDSDSTIYFFPSGLVRTGEELERLNRELLQEPPEGTRLLVGYVYGGFVTARRPPLRIAGSGWNYPSTFYRLPSGEIQRGDEIDPMKIPRGTLIFFRQ